MNRKSRPYVGLPDFLMLTDRRLQYLDVLVYTALKWYNNPEDECFPSQETVGKLAGLSRGFVINAIERLENAEIIEVVRSKDKCVSNHYYFAPPHMNKHLSKIPKDFFELTSDLTANERAMLLCLRQFFHHGHLEFRGTKPVGFFAECVGLTEPTVRKQFENLIKKEYIGKRYIRLKSCDDKADVCFFLTDKVDWDFREYETNKVIQQPTFLYVA